MSWNPLHKIKQSQAAVGRATPKAPSAADLIPGQLGVFQAAVEAAITAMAPMPTLAERARYKQRHALPAIGRFVDGYVQSGALYQNSVAVQAMIWLFDIGDIEHALRLGLYLAAQGCQRMPARFDRDLPTFICDGVYDWANEQLKADAAAAPYLGELLGEIQGKAWTLHPAVHSKLLAMAAKHALRDGDFKGCVDLCDAAQTVNPTGAGVKTLRAAAAAKLAPKAVAIVFDVGSEFNPHPSPLPEGEGELAPTQGENG